LNHEDAKARSQHKERAEKKEDQSFFSILKMEETSLAGRRSSLACAQPLFRMKDLMPYSRLTA
jgi:hypothetical protein